MADDREELAARAKWCRRLARDTLDETVRASLEEQARECDRRRDQP